MPLSGGLGPISRPVVRGEYGSDGYQLFSGSSINPIIDFTRDNSFCDDPVSCANDFWLDLMVSRCVACWLMMILSDLVCLIVQIHLQSFLFLRALRLWVWICLRVTQPVNLFLVLSLVIFKWVM